MQKHVNLVDLVKGFPTNIFLQILASIQKRTSSVKLAHQCACGAWKGRSTGFFRSARKPIAELGFFEVREKEQCLAYFSKEKDGNLFLYFKLLKLVIQIMQRYHTRSQEPW